MSGLTSAARSVVAAWDRIEEVRVDAPIEQRVALIRPHKDEFLRRLEVLREAVELAEVE